MTKRHSGRPFEWDKYSDQPRVILDKALKRRLRARHWPDILKMALVAGTFLPIAMINMGLQSWRKETTSKPNRNPAEFFGMGVSLDHGEAQFDMVAELGVREVLIRLPLWDLERLPAYIRFIHTWRNRGCGVMVNLLQSPDNVVDKAYVRRQATEVLSALNGLVGRVQVGNAINRAKWGFYSVAEYLHFYLEFQAARDAITPRMKLCGPAVIDFEYHYTALALFNALGLRFDQISALLYVDRCGHPDNAQLGVFHTSRKIRLLHALGSLSPKVVNPRLLITEVNWPLTGTAPYAPTSEAECVSENQYSDFMWAYHQAAFATGMVDTVYWHQLIAPGYGLVDNRGGKLRRRCAFEKYKTMVQSIL